MSNNKRTFQITLPTFEWKDFYTLPALVVALVALVSGGAMYWWKMVRPYFYVENARVMAPTLPIQAEHEGKLASLLVNEGSFFQAGQTLFSFEGQAAGNQQIEAKLEQSKERLEREKQRLEEAMESYIQAQEAPSDKIDQILVQVQESQQAIARAEEEVAILEAEKGVLPVREEKQVYAAPFAGLVLRQMKQNNEVALAGETILLICSKENRWVEVEIPEELLGTVQIGTPASLEFVAYPGKTWTAKISWISPMVVDGKLKIRMAADDLPMQLGLRATACLKIH